MNRKEIKEIIASKEVRMIRKIFGAAWRGWMTYRIEQLRGEIEAMRASIHSVCAEFPGNPFTEGFDEGNLAVVEIYRKAFKSVSERMPLNSYTALYHIFLEAQQEQLRPQPTFQFDVDQFVKNLNLDIRLN